MIASPSEGKSNTVVQRAPRHRWRVVVAILVLLIALGELVWFLVDRRETQRLDRVLDRLRAAGDPVSFDDLKARTTCDIPDPENMLTWLMDAAEVMAPLESDDVELLPYVGTAGPSPLGERLSPPVVEASKAYLGRVSAELSAVHTGLQCQRACLDESWTAALNDRTDLIHAGTRIVDMALALEATVAAGEGRDAEAAGVISDLYRFDKTTEWDQGIHGFLQCLARRGCADGVLADSMNRCLFTESELVSLQATLANEDIAVRFSQALKSERVDLIEGMKEGYLGVLRGIDPPGKATRLAWTLFPGRAARATTMELEVFDELLRSIKGPDISALRAIAAAKQRANSLPPYCLWIRNGLTVETSCGLWIRLVGEQRALRVMVAAERFRLAAGRWPEGLSALVPEYIEALPTDPFDGPPIRFSRIPEGIKVWRIKEDLKDDGGDVGQLDRTAKRKTRPTDAGWVLLDPALRGRTAQPQPKPDPAEEN